MTKIAGSILLVDDEEKILKALGRALRDDGHDVTLYFQPAAGRDSPRLGGCDAQPLAHAEGERSGPFACDVGQPDEVDDLLDAGVRDAVGLGQCEEVVVGGSSGVHGTHLE